MVSGVPSTRDDIELGQIVKARRSQLGLKQVDVINAVNERFGPKAISDPTYRALETGRTHASDRILAVVSQVLRWPADALRSIRDGADPATFPTVNLGATAADVAQQALDRADSGDVTLDMIKRWQLLTHAERLEVIAELDRRLADAGHPRVHGEQADRVQGPP